MAMSEKALESDRKSGIPLLPVAKIYANPDFNCRGVFGAAEVVDIARDIASRGLVEPIIVRKLWSNEKDLVKQGFEYSLIAGFRRHYAYRVNQATHVPAIVKEVNSDFECRDINAIENLQRLDLNLLQQANTIKHYWLADWSREEIAKRINKSPGWVQVRIIILEMPEEIQVCIAQGYILQDDLKILNKVKHNKHDLLKTAAIIRDRRKSGQKKNVLSHVPKKEKAESKRIRKTNEILEIMETVRKIGLRANREKTLPVSVLVSEQGNSIMTRLMAWQIGEISSMELHVGLRRFAKLLDVNYDLPNFAEPFDPLDSIT